MDCPRCKAENREGRHFCSECGAPLALACPACGFTNQAGEKFCGGCGQLLAAAPTADTRFSSPQAYTPKHLAEKILTSKGALEGERKQVTVLFADLRGSMELLADADPEEARQILDPVLEHMMEAVHRYEGTVNQVMGDGIMALFGAPLAHEDHAVRACYAALRMQESVKRYAQEVQRTEGIPIQIRIGMNSGEVVVRSIGSDLRMDYTAVGQTTHLAARMEQMAMPGSILLTADALRLAEGYVQVKPLGPFQIKGLTDPVEVYEAAGAGPARTRLQASAARGLTRFVGREAELETLRQALDKARAGHGQVVALVGEPGVGKSRLFWEFTHSHRTHGWLVLESGSVSYGKATAYLPVIDLLRAYFQVEASDDGRKIREKVTGKLLTLERALEATLPAFLALLDVPVEDPHWQALDPPQRRQRTLDAVKHLLLRESQVQPLCLVFEDLHWIDSETQALLDSLIESLPTAHVLLLLNYRPEYQHGWGSKTYYTQIRIDPLPPESCHELLQALLGSVDGLEPLKRLLIERTEGNPFFLEESVRTLVETQVLVGERGAYRLAKAAESIQVPATVQAILAARIDRLPAEEKRLLQSAAVIGVDVPYSVLQAIGELAEEKLRASLTHLQAAEFLYETSLFPDLEYTFKHALTHEVAYGSLLQERRRDLHARIVEAIERLYTDRLAEQVERLAHHALRGEVWDKALVYLRQAGAKALERSAYREALACYEQALAALAHLRESRETLEQAVDLRIELRHSLFPLGELDRIDEYLREAEALAEALGDQLRLGRVSSVMAQHLRLIGDPERGIAYGQRALAIAEAVGDLPLKVTTNFYLGTAYFTLGDHRRGIELLRWIVGALEGDLIRERFGLAASPSVFSRSFICLCLGELGEFAEAIRLGEEAVRIAEAVDQPFGLAHAGYAVGRQHLRKGDLGSAIPPLERSLEVCQAWQIRLPFPLIASSLACAYALSGRVAESLPLLEKASEQAASMGIMPFRSILMTALSEGYLLSGRTKEALGLTHESIEICRRQKERGSLAHALRLFGELTSQQEPPDTEKAEASYLEALALAAELGMRPLEAQTHLGLGGLYGRTGQRNKAREHLTIASGLFREMEMGFWLERSEAELKALR